MADPLNEEKVTVVTDVVVEPTEIVVLPANRPRKVYGGMWGPIEIAAVAAGLMILLGGVFAYLYFKRPTDQDLAKNRVEADRLEAELASARSRYGEINSSQDRVDELITSVDDFEARFLPIATSGRTALYQRLNGLINAYGLINTTGPDYAPLEAINDPREQQSEESRGKARLRSLYPGVYVTTTVEGSYQSLRRFLREIETGREFIVISAVELSPSDSQRERPDSTSPQSAQAAPQQMNPNMPPGFNNMPTMNQAQQQPAQSRPQGKRTGDIVSLRLELASYFRRPNFAPPVAAGQ